ncbi:helix-turn-helix domain-containing protein [Micromonospora sp. M61]|uniref:helix-turn-helix domain-containing protein n=1 Tax=Micromonospora sp. M61 TaxID=2824890 RepID=UPI001B38816E|nr:helix-turn-helix domain-containing protein [Micromonospora sp. M61]MBQ0979200.1 helix-turn-helix domain-containing protein [Micromonospora sp. M61]
MIDDEQEDREECSRESDHERSHGAVEKIPRISAKRFRAWIMTNNPNRITILARNFLRDNPVWLTVIIGLASLGIILGGATLLGVMAADISEKLARVPSTAAAKIVTDSVGRYFDENSENFPIDPQALRRTWIGFGALAWALSVWGAVGARFAWLLFGLLTAGMVWVATSPPSQWLAVGITVVWWSGLAVFAYRRVDRGGDGFDYDDDDRNFGRGGVRGRGGTADSMSRYLGGVSSEARGAALQRRMDSAITKSEYANFDAFFRSNCTKRIKDIAFILDVPEWLVREMKAETYPAGSGWRMQRVPWQIQHDAAKAHLVDGEKVASIAARHGASPSAVRRWIKAYQSEFSSEADAVATQATPD